MLLFHTFWLVICKLMRIRIQLITSMRTPNLYLDPDRTFQFDADLDPQHWYPTYVTISYNEVQYLFQLPVLNRRTSSILAFQKKEVLY
jgi:hypothetical protein